MDDPTKDTIPRSAVEYCLRKETVNTNPDAYEAHEKFIAYMDDPDISQFGHWMHSNGFNCALTAIAVDLDKIPSVTAKEHPETIHCRDCKRWDDSPSSTIAPTFHRCRKFNNHHTEATDFCSYAERREE